MLDRQSMNAIELLKQQHEITKDALERMSEGDIDKDELRLMADELVAHMVIEEHIFYPRIRQLKKDLVQESFEEHAVARFELARAMIVSGEERKTRLTVLKELIEHHVEEEENEMFPKVLKSVPARELEVLGEKMEAMFDKAVAAGLDKLVVGGVELRPAKTNGARAPSGTMTPRARAGAKGGRTKAKTTQSRGSRSRAAAR